MHDKQVELPIRHFEDKSIYQRYHSGDQRISTKDSIPDMNDVNDFKFNDPFFNDQWYLVGSFRLYLINVKCSCFCKIKLAYRFFV